MSFDAHFQLVTIHPWVDGNGRMSRLVMNHLQYEFGLTPSKIVKEDKAEYIQSLIDAREQETLAPYRDMVEEHIRNLTREIESFKKSQASDPINIAIDPINKFADPITEQLYQAILKDNTLNYAAYGKQIGISEATLLSRVTLC